MRGKRPRSAISPPECERMVWGEEKTARGSRLTARASGSPRTPKAKRHATPLHKMRRIHISPISQAGPSVEVNHTPGSTIDALKKRPGKVCVLMWCFSGSIY